MLIRADSGLRPVQAAEGPADPHGLSHASGDKGKVLTVLATGDAGMIVVHRRGAVDKYTELGK